MAFMDLLDMNWATVAMLVALVSFLITVLLHMFSQAFSLQSLNMWVKSEYSQVAVSFLIILFAVAMQSAGARVVSAVSADVSAASGNMQLNYAVAANFGKPAEIGKAYLQSVIECEKKIYVIAYWLNLFVEAFSKISLDILGVEGLGAGLVLSGYVSLYHYIMNNIVYLVLYHYIQYNILQFSQYTMLYPFLPLGLLLRAFAPTRGAGGLVTAFALGFAFIFPMSYVLIIAIMPNVDAACSQVEYQARPENQVLGTTDPCFNNAGGLMENYYLLKGNQRELSSIGDFLKESTKNLFLQAIFYPLAALIITISFIRQTGSLLGADLAEIGRGLIKLI